MQEDKRLYMPKEDELSDPEEMLQVQPLITKKHERTPQFNKTINEVAFRVFNEEEESTKIIQLICLKQSYAKMILVVPLLAICTGLFFLLFLYWYPTLRKKFLYSECPMDQATHLFIVGTMKHMEIVEVQNRNHEIQQFLGAQDRQAFDQSPFLIFEYRFIKYQFDYLNDMFTPIVFDCSLPFQTIHSKYSQGILNEADYKMQLLKYGRCNIEVPIKSIPRLLVEEILNPFYLFQIFSMALWYWDGYRSYATCILLISVTSAVTSLVETLSNLRNIRKMANYSCAVNTMRNGDEGNLVPSDSQDLVPGDVIEIPENCSMPCDLVLLTGSCIVNESMLTGESIPVIKNSLPFTNDIYNPDEDQKYTLYGGTKVIQTRRFGNSKVLGLVIRTAFVTTKGNLVRDILYPRPNKFKFYSDSLKFIFVMGLIAIIGFLGTLPMMINQGYETWAIVDRSLDLITITVPPALPAAMTAGTAFAISRLKKKKIFCISPPRVNVSGRVNLMVFDKTGTLTEDGLQVFGYRGVEPALIHNKTIGVFGQFTPDCKSYQPQRKWWNDALERQELENDSRTLFLEGLASCHSITYVNGELIGDPLDVKMFQATGWQLEEQIDENNADELILAYVKPPQSVLQQQKYVRADSLLSISDTSMNEGFIKEQNYQLALIRRFDFSSKLQRMTVIVKNFLDQSFKAFVKGSPERIRELCSEASLPANYDEILEIYTECGYRVLALAHKPLNINFLKSQKILREEVECDLEFLGFLIMQNKLKPVTVSVIQTLNVANIRTIMATGDNVLTAISVGRECNIIEGDAEVFLGEVRKEGDKEVVFWKSTKNDRHKLQPQTLIPNEQFYSDEQKKPGYNTTMRMEIEQSREEDEQSVNDIVSLEDFPWQHPPEQYGIAITGKAFNILITDPTYAAVLKQVLLKAQIYARMSPDDKAKLVEKLQAFCKTEVGMCGDGANDCGALKQADVGLSLSEAEASIAAPFTSQIQDISSVVILLREGRCALTTSFQCFKFIELYSMIQFVTVTMLYSVGSNLSDFQFLYIDLFVLIPLSIFMGSTDAYKSLTPHLPAGSLLSLPVLVSVLGSSIIQCAFQIFMFFYIKQWSFYEQPKIDPANPEASYQCYENTSIMFVSCFQYLVVCMVFSLSKPFRQPLYTNIPFTISLTVLLVFNTYLVASNDKFVTWLLDLEPTVNMTFRLSAFVVIAINSLISYGYEKIVVWYISQWWKNRKDRIMHEKQQLEIREQQEIAQVESQKRITMKYSSKVVNEGVELYNSSKNEQKLLAEMRREFQSEEIKEQYQSR